MLFRIAGVRKLIDNILLVTRAFRSQKKVIVIHQSNKTDAPGL